MSNLNKRYEILDDDGKEEENALESLENNNKEKPVKAGKANKVFIEFMGGGVLSRKGFVKLFPFLLYVVLLLMIYITNIYIAEDMSREIAKLNRDVEDRHVEYIYLKSEITNITKQSNLAKNLESKGIKESVEPLRKIIVTKEGGEND